MHVADRLRALREEKNLTREELAEEIRVAVNTVYCWERGLTNPSLALAAELAEYYGVSLDWIAGLSETKGPPA